MSNLRVYDVSKDAMVSFTVCSHLTKELVEQTTNLWIPQLQEQGSEHAHWRWDRKHNAIQGVNNYTMVGGLVGSEVQGFILYEDLVHKSRREGCGAQDVVYVEYISVAPWNDGSRVTTPKYKAVGLALMALAIQRSQALGYKGRVGLHALPQSENCYTRWGLEDLGIDESYEGLRSFEFTSEKAGDFLKKVMD